MHTGLGTDIVRVEGANLDTWRGGLTDVYARVFRAEPWCETAETVRWFGGEWLDYCASLDTFRCFAAVDDDTVVGFSMGIGFDEHHDWFSALVRELEGDRTVDWLSDTFFLHELAVLEAHRGFGLGAALHDALLDSTSSTRALLTTQAVGPARAATLFVSRGWRLLFESWEAWPGATPDHVMALLRRDGS